MTHRRMPDGTNRTNAAQDTTCRRRYITHMRATVRDRWHFPRVQPAAYLWVCVVTVLCVVFIVPSTFGANDSVIVSGEVPSSSTMNTSGCQSGTAGITDFGTVVGGSSSVTTNDCSITFGSPNDTAKLRVYQSDGAGSAMSTWSSGTLDTSFSTDGRETYNYNATIDNDGAESVAVQRDGKIVVVGTVTVSGNDFLYAFRTNQDGSVDTSFGTNGWKIPYTTSQSYGMDVAIQDDGKIVIVGNTTQSNNDGIIIRLNTDGSADTSFSGDGIATYNDSSNGNDIFYALTVRSDGSMIAVGQWSDATFGISDLEPLIVVYSSTGSVVHDGNIVGSPDPEKYQDVAVSPTGDIVAAGFTSLGSGNKDTLVNMYSSSFHAIGISAYGGLTAGSEAYYAAAFDSQGRLYLGGTGKWTNADYMVARVIKSGSSWDLDPTFGVGGLTHLDVTTAESVQDLLIPGDDTIFAMGTKSTSRPTVWRIRSSDGNADLRFGANGYLEMTGYAAGVTGSGGALGTDGRIITVGDGNITSKGREAALSVLQGIAVNDYGNTVNDWDQGSGAFGACLRSATGTGAAPIWTSTGTCSSTDNGTWFPIAATATSAGSTVATSTTPTVTNVTANIRFGFRATSNIAPGDYRAQLTFDVIAPNV